MLKLKPIGVLLLPVMLCACSTSDASSETSLSPKVCKSWETIRPSRKDTADTLRQVAGNNVARDAWCSDPPKFAGVRVRA